MNLSPNSGVILADSFGTSVRQHCLLIAQAYKRAALKYHPDKAAAGERDEAEKKFKQVNAANTILSDPAKRQRYDAGRPPCFLSAGEIGTFRGYPCACCLLSAAMQGAGCQSTYTEKAKCGQACD